MMEQEPLELNDDFKYTLNLIENSNQSVFITGRAGTGKSTLLKIFRNSTKKKVVTLAPTGIAALNVQGQTIHSFFGFPPKIITKRDIKQRRIKKLFKKLQVIIIDEISMVRADMLDNIDYFMRINGPDFHKPFGGVQMVFFGDLFQLPPVVVQEERGLLMQMGYETPYFFSSVAYRSLDCEMIELYKVYRQTQRHFLRLLENIRMNQIDWDDMEMLNERVVPLEDEDDFYIMLSARNSTVKAINSRRLARLNGYDRTYLATVSGNFSDRVFPTEMALILKDGAQVMFLRNDPKGRFVNGTIGKVAEMNFDKIKVEIETPAGYIKTIEVERESWEILKHKLSPTNEIETETVGTFQQFPLKLAWAMTIHKSQGKTFDKIIIDLGKGAFEHGQTYVALSRCRTFQGIILKTPIKPQDIRTDPRVVEFYETSLR